MKMNRMKTTKWIFAALIVLSACKKEKNSTPTPKDPNTAEDVEVDRFSSTAGHLQVRTATNGLPGPNQAINFDQGPFITTGLSPTGASVQYYNFDVQPAAPAPIWEFYKNGQHVDGQLNIVNVIPGVANYNDFWQVYKVNVPTDYVANTITSYQELVASGYPIEKTNNLVNCPIVPKGSTATKRLNNGDASLTKGWYNGKIVYYFNFFEKALSVTGNDMVPAIPIYVTFNVNPNQPGGGPDSGFKTESTTSAQTHNVLTALPSDPVYSPLWTVKVYDNASFGNVNNVTTATAAPLLEPNAGLVNCPVVKIQ
jgi:hypothetical protein